MKKYSILFLMVFLYQYVTAQVTGEVNVLDRDVFYLQYTPKNEISETINYQKFSSKMSVPPIRFRKLSFFNTIGLDIHDFKYNDPNPISNTGELNRFYNVNYSLFANYKFSNKWSLNALIAPFIVSNFKQKFSFDDMQLNGNIYIERTFLRKKGGYFQVSLGIGYMTLNGTTQVTPITQIKARLNEKLSFVLGLPNTYVKWDINKKHSLKVLGDLNDFSTKLKGINNTSNNTKENTVVFTTVSAGLEYNFWLTSSLGLMLKGTYTVWGNYEIRDEHDISSFKFNTSFNQPFIGVGIKFNPIRSLQNNLNPL